MPGQTPHLVHALRAIWSANLAQLKIVARRSKHNITSIECAEFAITVIYVNHGSIGGALGFQK